MGYLLVWFCLQSSPSEKRKRETTIEDQRQNQADTKDLTSSSKFSACCVLTLQTISFSLAFTVNRLLGFSFLIFGPSKRQRTQRAKDMMDVKTERLIERPRQQSLNDKCCRLKPGEKEKKKRPPGFNLQHQSCPSIGLCIILLGSADRRTGQQKELLFYLWKQHVIVGSSKESQSSMDNSLCPLVGRSI